MTDTHGSENEPRIKSIITKSSASLTRKGYGYLPKNILQNIFKYMTEEELRTSVIPVCQQWRAVAEEPQFWKVLKFSGSKTSTSVINHKIWQFNLVEKIIARRISEPVPIIRQICRCNTHLVQLTLRHCPEVNEDSLRHLIVSCKVLKSLDLKGTSFKSLIFCEELAYSNSLSSLNFSENKYLTVANINSIIVNCHQMDGFHISTFQPVNKVPLTDIDVNFLCSQASVRLLSLTLDCCSLHGPAFGAILKCKNLIYLCLNYAYNFEGKDFQMIGDSLKNLKSLKVRFGHQIDDSHFHNLFENGKKSLSQIQVLDFTGCSKLSTFGLKALALCCRNLKTLILRNCKNVIKLDVVFIHCELLEVLNIAFCTKIQLVKKYNTPSLRELFINDSQKMISFAKSLNENDNIVIQICESEYNKNYKKIYKSALFQKKDYRNKFLDNFKIFFYFSLLIILLYIKIYMLSNNWQLQS